MSQEAGAEVAQEAPKNDFVTTETQREVKAADEAPTKTEAEVKPEVEADHKDSSEGKKPRTGWQRKIAKLERELAQERARNAQNQQTAPKAAENAPGRPKPESFQTTEDWVEAVSDWKADQKVNAALEKRDNEAKQKAEEQKTRESLQQKGERYEKAKEEIRKTRPDFDEKINAYDGPESPMILTALLDCESPAKVALYLAENLEEADTMENMDIVELNKFLAKIDAKVSYAPKQEVQETQEAAVKTTKAPRPVSPVKGGAKADVGPPDDYDDYRTWRKRNP